MSACNLAVIGLVDTNCDPKTIDYVVPSNDDAIRAIKLMAGKMADAVLEGLELRTVDEADRATAVRPQAEVEPEDELAAEKPTASDYFDREDFGTFEAEPEELLGPSVLAKLAQGLDGETEDK